jgi:hypothetical protein
LPTDFILTTQNNVTKHIITMIYINV